MDHYISPPTLCTIPLGFDDAAYNIATYLSTKDGLSLASVNRGWRDALAKHEVELFTGYLVNDFVEGTALTYVAKNNDISHKKLYLAFRRKWNLEKQCDKRMCIPWRRPLRPAITNNDYDDDGADDNMEDEDVRALVFIARIGGNNDNISEDQNTCAIMEWGYRCDNRGRRISHNKVVLREAYNEDEEEHIGNGETWCLLPYNERADQLLTEGSENNDTWFRDLEASLKKSHSLTLHAIDVRTIQVLTLMDDNKSGELWSGRDAPFQLVGHRSRILYGLPPKRSIFYKDYSEEEWDKFERWDGSDSYYNSIECLEICGGLDMACHWPWNELSICNENDGLHFTADDIECSSIRKHSSICNYLRALMREKCAVIDRTVMTTSSPILPQQPIWVQNEKILGRVISYAPFEDQAGDLRLICKQFEQVSLSHLRMKLDKNKTIGDGFSLHRGWTDTHLTSNTSAIEDALWLASCRCNRDTKCNSSNCPSMSNDLRYYDDFQEIYHKNPAKEPEVADKDKIRTEMKKLMDEPTLKRGWFHLKEPELDGRIEDYPTSNLECSFDRKEMSLLNLCDVIETLIHRTTDRDGMSEGEPCRMNYYTRKAYGISKNDFYSKQFVRTVFLLLAKEKDVISNQDKTARKKARMASIEDVTIGMAKAYIIGDDNEHYIRKMRISRFCSASYDPVEIRMEYRSSYSW